MTNKKLYISLTIFLIACAIAIITCCVVFISPNSSNNESNSPTPRLTNDYIQFDYGNNLDIVYGGGYDLTPTIGYDAGECNISYVSKDTSILEVDASGQISTLKCGVANVEIMNNNLTIKTVAVNVKPKIVIMEEDGVTVDNLTITTSKGDFKLKISLLNDSNEEVFTNITPKLSTNDDIEFINMFGMISIAVNESGVVHISYPEVNVCFDITINKI